MIVDLLMEIEPLPEGSRVSRSEWIDSLRRRATTLIKHTDPRNLRNVELTWKELKHFAKQRGTEPEELEVAELDAFVHGRKGPVRASLWGDQEAPQVEDAAR